MDKRAESRGEMLFLSRSFQIDLFPIYLPFAFAKNQVFFGQSATSLSALSTLLPRIAKPDIAFA